MTDVVLGLVDDTICHADVIIFGGNIGRPFEGWADWSSQTSGAIFSWSGPFDAGRVRSGPLVVVVVERLFIVANNGVTTLDVGFGFVPDGWVDFDVVVGCSTAGVFRTDTGTCRKSWDRTSVRLCFVPVAEVVVVVAVVRVVG